MFSKLAHSVRGRVGWRGDGPSISIWDLRCNIDIIPFFRHALTAVRKFIMIPSKISTFEFRNPSHRCCPPQKFCHPVAFEVLKLAQPIVQQLSKSDPASQLF